MYQVVYSNTFRYTPPRSCYTYSESVRLISRETLLTRRDKYYLTINGDDPRLRSHNTNGEIVLDSKEVAFEKIFPVWAHARLMKCGRFEQIARLKDDIWDDTTGDNPVFDYIVKGNCHFVYQNDIKYFDGFSYELKLSGWSGNGEDDQVTNRRRSYNVVEFFRSVLPSFNPYHSYKVRLSDEKLWIYSDEENNKEPLWSYNQDVETLFLLFAVNRF